MLEAPSELVISTNECHAGLSLIRLIAQNIIERGDVSEEVFELLLKLSSDIKALNQYPTGKEEAVLRALSCTGLLPTFDLAPRKGREQAGAALLELILAKFAAA